MPRGLRRFQESGHSHFVTFSCWRRQPYFSTQELFDLFVQCLEDMRVRFDLRMYGYVVMPEHVHLLLSEPAAFSQVSAQRTSANLGHQPSFHQASLADAIHYLKLSFAKRARGIRPGVAQARLSQVSAQGTSANLGHRHSSSSFWEKRYHDRNVRDVREFTGKLRYLHRNPVKRGLVRTPEEWTWSSYRHYALREISMVEIESEWTARDREWVREDERVFLVPR
jgi:putative transposase